MYYKITKCRFLWMYAYSTQNVFFTISYLKKKYFHISMLACIIKCYEYIPTAI